MWTIRSGGRSCQCGVHFQQRRNRATAPWGGDGCAWIRIPKRTSTASPIERTLRCRVRVDRLAPYLGVFLSGIGRFLLLFFCHGLLLCRALRCDLPRHSRYSRESPAAASSTGDKLGREAAHTEGGDRGGDQEREERDRPGDGLPEIIRTRSRPHDRVDVSPADTHVDPHDGGGQSALNHPQNRKLRGSMSRKGIKSGPRIKRMARAIWAHMTCAMVIE